MAEPAFPDVAVAAAFNAFPATHRPRLLQLRGLILAVGENTLGSNALMESLKWGEPAYRPIRNRIGTTVRLGLSRQNPRSCAVFVHCKTDLLDRFREFYSDAFGFEGNRALMLPLNAPIPTEALKHCIALALTYHAKRRSDQAVRATS